MTFPFCWHWLIAMAIICVIFASHCHLVVVLIGCQWPVVFPMWQLVSFCSLFFGFGHHPLVWSSYSCHSLSAWSFCIRCTVLSFFHVDALFISSVLLYHCTAMTFAFFFVSMAHPPWSLFFSMWSQWIKSLVCVGELPISHCGHLLTLGKLVILWLPLLVMSFISPLVSWLQLPLHARHMNLQQHLGAFPKFCIWVLAMATTEGGPVWCVALRWMNSIFVALAGVLLILILTSHSLLFSLNRPRC